MYDKKIIICKNWIKNLKYYGVGNCNYGYKCNFVHGIEDSNLNKILICNNPSDCLIKNCKSIHNNIWYINNEKYNSFDKFIFKKLKSIKIINIENGESASSDIELEEFYEDKKSGKRIVKFKSEPNLRLLFELNI